MKAHEMREMTTEELQSHHETLVEELVNLKIKLAVKQIDNPLRVRIVRKEIARSRTVLQEKNLGAAPGETLKRKKPKKA